MRRAGTGNVVKSKKSAHDTDMLIHDDTPHRGGSDRVIYESTVPALTQFNIRQTRHCGLNHKPQRPSRNKISFRNVRNDFKLRSNRITSMSATPLNYELTA